MISFDYIPPKPFYADPDRRTRDLAVRWLLGLNLLDVVTTTLALHHGAHEGNPLMRPFAAHWVLLALVKVLVCAWYVVIVRAQPNVRRAMLGCTWLVGIYSFVQLNNLIVLAHHLP